jgi:hypothetical protein
MVTRIIKLHVGRGSGDKKAEVIESFNESKPRPYNIGHHILIEDVFYEIVDIVHNKSTVNVLVTYSPRMKGVM